MHNVLNKWIMILCVILLVPLVGCGGGDDNAGGSASRPTPTPSPRPDDPTPPPPPGASSSGGSSSTSSSGGVIPTTGTISGKVLHADTAAAIAGATVTAGAITDTTAGDGTFSLANIPFSTSVIVNVENAGYADQSQIYNLGLNELDVRTTISMVPEDDNTAFDPAVGATLTSAPAQVVIGANTLETAASAPPAAGNVTPSMTIIDPGASLYYLPGAYLLSGGTTMLESYGALHVEIEDSAGDQLNLITGQTASIRIPVDSKTATPPNGVNLYWYDSSTGFWTQDGTATLTGSYYEGTVSHFNGTWMAGSTITNPINVTGCAFGLNSNFLAGITVKTEGDNYNSFTRAFTNSTGQLTIPAKRSATILVSATKNGVGSNTIQVTSPDSDNDYSLSACILQGGAATVKLTWGQNPSDLDTHFREPTTPIHILYSNKGALFSAPYVALDVDDVTSFGPEILTVARFTSAGSYTYSVYEYSGSGDIQSSPTRVELNVGGDTTVFTPTGYTAGDRVWNVFRLDVDASFNITVVPLNTWEATPSFPVN